MKKVACLAVVIIFGFNLLAFAETSIKAEVDKKSITTDDTLTYKVIISTEEKDIPQPEFPKLIGFRVLSSAQTSQIVFAKGIEKTGAVFVFILAPLEAGKFRIDPATINVKGKPCSSDSFEIEVSQGRAKPQPKQDKGPIPKSEEPQYTL
jgi:hypothetical protein